MKRNRKPHGRAAPAFAPGGPIIANAVHLWGRLPAQALAERARASGSKVFIGIVIEGPAENAVVASAGDALAEVVGVHVHRHLRAWKGA